MLPAVRAEAGPQPMFTCSHCGHEINAPEARLPPFCPRCGSSTGAGSNPFADSMIDDDDNQLDQLPPPPPMDSLPVSRSHGRSGPSKTLFGMPGINADELELEDEGTSNFSAPAKPAAPPAKPPAAPAKPAAPPAKPAAAPVKPAAPPVKPPAAPVKPPAAPAKPPAAPAKPSAAPAKPAPAPVVRPPLPGAVPVAPKPSAAKPPALAPLGGKLATPATADAPIKPSARAPSAPTGPGRPAPKLREDSGGFGQEESGTFEKDDPFFTGNPDELSELASITDGDVVLLQRKAAEASGPVGMQEFEFDDKGGSKLELGDLELLGGSSAEVVDLPKATSQSGRALAEFDGIEMPLPADDLDLPSPVVDATDGLDLPMSSAASRPDELEFDGFGGLGEDLDLPMPTDSGALELDLPMPQTPAKQAPVPTSPSKPAATPSKPAATPSKPAATPSKPAATPSKPPPPSKPPASPSKPPPPALPELSDDFDLDLPTPALDLPTPASELPARKDDFSGYSMPEGGLDLELEDLPLPADMLPVSADSLPTSASKSKTSGSLPTSTASLPTSASELPTPVETLGLDLGDEVPVKTATPSATKPTEPGHGQPGLPPPPPPRKSPAPKPERASPVRWVLYGVLGVVVAGLGLGVYGMGEGWFASDDELPPPQAGNGGDGGNDGSEQPANSAEVAERSEAILAKFDEDSPSGYVQVLDGLATDPVAQAEAALLLHLRYGPDPVRLAQAGKLLDAYAENPAPHVRRVLGLALLTQPARSTEALTWFASDPRSQLYRAWALQASDPGQARLAAEAASKARPGDKAALLTLAEIQLASDPDAALTRLRTIIGQQPQQISAQVALLRAAREQGLLAEAAQLGNGLSAVSVSDGYKASLLRTRSAIARAQGNVAEASRLIEQAIASDVQTIGPRLDKIDIALSVRDSGGARTEVELLLRERPQDRAVLIAAARVAIEAGRDDDALAHVQALGGPESTDVAVHELTGEIEALLLDVRCPASLGQGPRTRSPAQLDDRQRGRVADQSRTGCSGARAARRAKGQARGDRRSDRGRSRGPIGRRTNPRSRAAVASRARSSAGCCR